MYTGWWPGGKTEILDNLLQADSPLKMLTQPVSGFSPAAYCFLVGVKTHEENNMADQFKCSKCGKTFSSQSELKEHEKNCNKK